jgi:hypothetical protein
LYLEKSEPFVYVHYGSSNAANSVPKYGSWVRGFLWPARSIPVLKFIQQLREPRGALSHGVTDRSDGDTVKAKSDASNRVTPT